jgi:hypothetical protein
MDALVRVIKRPPYRRYHEMREKIEPVFTLFLSSPASDYDMSEIATRTNIPLRTLYTWRTHLKHDPKWHPQTSRFHNNPRSIEDELEAEMASYIRDHFVSLGNDLSTLALKQTLTMLVHGFVACHKLPATALNFKCSTTYMRRFLKRTGLSFRHARPARRPVLDESECDDFLFAFHLSLDVLGRSAVVNFDESNWRLVMTGNRTVAERGSETVERFVNGDVKAGFTFFASILADGTKLPLILIAKGKTERCRRQLGLHPTFPHDVWHSPTGWCHEELMVAYLSWLRKYVAATQICLVLDQFGAHDTPAVRQTANSLSIELLFVPRGGTGRYQPLDRRTFGALKAKGRAKWSQECANHPGMICTRDQAAELLLSCWDELSPDSVLSGWDLDKAECDEDSSSDDSEQEWTLEISTSDDEDPDDDSDSDMDEVVEDPVARFGYGVF